MVPGRWNPCAVGLLAALLAAGCGDAGGGAGGGAGTPLRAYPPPVPLKPAQLDPPGFWSASGKGEGLWARTPTISPEEAATALDQTGYAQGFRGGPQEAGVFVHDAERVQPGPNLYVSGHAPEATLMAADGTVLHRWSHEYAAIPGAPSATTQQAGCWRKAVATPDGRLYAIHEGVGLVALERDSTLRWFHPGGQHHDLQLLDDVGDGRPGLIVLARSSRVVPAIHAEYPVLEDAVLWMDRDGNVVRSLSLLDAWLTSDFSSVLESRPYLVGDITHTNSIEVLAGEGTGVAPAFAPGNLLLSSRMLDAVFVVDPASDRVVWAQRGPWLRQHDASLTDAGTVLLFDNRGYRGYSQVLEIDPAALVEHWAYRASPPSDFDSIFLGSAQRLANGNTLVTEGCAGRAFEVTPAGDVVWEFVSGHRAGDDDELVAALFDVTRMPAGFGADW